MSKLVFFLYCYIILDTTIALTLIIQDRHKTEYVKEYMKEIEESFKIGKDFNQDNYPISFNDLDMNSEVSYFTNFSCMFLSDDYENWRNIKLTPIMGEIGFGSDKVDFEDDTLFLYILNKFARSPYQGKLSRNIVFYICW